MTGVEAILLAAGTGSRFGGGKLLAPWGHGVLLDAALTTALAAPVRSVTLVTGADSEKVAAAATACARGLGALDRLNIVEATDYAEGMGASLRRGAAALPADTAAVFVLLGDMPKIPGGIFQPLIDAVEAGAPAAAAAFQGKRGHPALIGRDLIPGLLTLKGDAGARAVLKALGDRLVQVEAPDDGVLFDVDERRDLTP
ncbi:MAG: molybdopterin-guanine dinucleotide biosynthesis protein MobA [Alphaproteobacteria bacterium PA2]|nr:MAG: molybdopterin-guanine dinucleotide biosynthesis protein MobA [Alphaproteobacteria bacterium PA2]